MSSTMLQCIFLGRNGSPHRLAPLNSLLFTLEARHPCTQNSHCLLGALPPLTLVSFLGWLIGGLSRAR